MKKTAVDWLVERLNKLGFAQVVTDEEIGKAKEMEKEQIEYSYYEAWTESDGYYRDEKSILKIAEQYYKETYGDE